MPVAALHVHASCAPGRVFVNCAPVTRSIKDLVPNVLQSATPATLLQVGSSSPGAAQVGVPVMQVGEVPEQ